MAAVGAVGEAEEQQKLAAQKALELIEGGKLAPVYEVGEWPSDIVRLSRLREELQKVSLGGIQTGPDPGWKGLRELYRPAKGLWTVITGIPSHGKSTWLDCLLINLMVGQGWRFAVFSAENLPPQQHALKLIQKYSGTSFWGMKAQSIEYAIQQLDEHFYLLNPEDDERTLDYILKQAFFLVDLQKIDGLVIDPWNEVDHSRPERLTETEWVSDCLSKIRSFARKYDIHIWVVAHPTKLRPTKDGRPPVAELFDISGSAHWANKCDFGITVWRDPHQEQLPTEIHVKKVRFAEHGKTGSKALLRYDKKADRFYDVV